MQARGAKAEDLRSHFLTAPELHLIGLRRGLGKD
jgi:hypothetical protein